MKLKDKTVLVTGASSGIGKAIASKCAADGATVVLAARSEDKLYEVKSEVEKLGGKGIVIPTDVTDDEAIKKLFLEATEDGRILDVVFDNAGVGFIGNIQDLTREQIRAMIDVNLTGMIMVAKYASEVMVRQKHGHIIMTSSLAGLITIPQWSVYVATKWGITGFADSIRPELKQYNVKVTTIHPGAVKTDFFSREKANLDLKDYEDAVDASVIAFAAYEAVFTGKRKVLVPKMAQNYALLFKFLPGILQKTLEKQAKDFQYTDEPKEDEKEFSYVKCVTCGE
ncbi:MAG: SDR family NAD(P)-dependent oxidoreductase [Candidatus Dojkabacteria bacterium]|nr:SDR family NAD(P)-dependent oxidoreductase [Candidatus Dojkabacteria bacterium]